MSTPKQNTNPPEKEKPQIPRTLWADKLQHENQKLRDLIKKTAERIRWAVDNGHDTWWLSTANELEDALNGGQTINNKAVQEATLTTSPKVF